MTSSIGAVGGARSSRRVRRRRTEESASAAEAGRAEAGEGVEAAAPIPPGEIGPQHAAPAVSAQLIGQSDSAEGAAPAKSAARRASGAYLEVEFSGRYDRRTRRGRVAKTDV
ncbi:MAG TPA: hypothetical protein VGM25_15025 [Caulobacteraceae bacterium]|jgi:hypothetical protein